MCRPCRGIPQRAQCTQPGGPERPPGSIRDTMPELRELIPTPDGVHLAATLFLPETAGPWPAILEANPYRKDDLTQSYWSEYRRLRDEGDFAVVRVDVRGTGSSEGVATDEYPVQEQDDLCEVIAWLASREWTN